MNCPGPMKYADLGYAPTYGSVEIRGGDRSWSVDVTVEQGRAMEEDGVPVYWIYGSVPVGVADAGLVGPWLAFYRGFTWPSRFFR